MIIIKLDGGLGNQMFQFALYLKYQFQNKIVSIDDDYLRLFGNAHNGLELPYIFDLSYNRGALKNVSPYDILRKIPILRSVYTNHEIRNKHIYIEESLVFHKDYLYWNNIYLDGYWQSPMYFEDIRDVILSNYTFKNLDYDLTFEAQDYLNIIANSNSVSIHIRRGDYLAESNRMLPDSYYSNAIHYVLSNIDNPTFFIFSDDIEWCKNNLDIAGEHIFIEYIEPCKSYIDMYLMTQCNHNIIANSSFSWWGAWLNDNPNKIVIGPKNWFNDGTEIDIYPDSWVKI